MKKEKQNSQVLSLRISNKDLAGCLLFEELLTGSSSSKLISSITLLIRSSLKLLTENKKLPPLTEAEALLIIQDFSKRTNRSFIGKNEILERVPSLIGERINFFGPTLKETPPAKGGLEEEAEAPAEIASGEQPPPAANSEEEETLRKQYREKIEETSEEIRAEEELDLLSKIFMPS